MELDIKTELMFRNTQLHAAFQQRLVTLTQLKCTGDVLSSCTSSAGFAECVSKQMAPCVEFRQLYDQRRLEFLNRAKQDMIERCQGKLEVWECCQEVVDRYLSEPLTEFVSKTGAN
jgi:hypothetical protein